MDESPTRREKHAHRDSQGRGKLGYETRKGAKAAARRSERAYGIKGLRAYQCHECLQYHIGHTPVWMQKE